MLLISCTGERRGWCGELHREEITLVMSYTQQRRCSRDELHREDTFVVSCTQQRRCFKIELNSAWPSTCPCSRMMLHCTGTVRKAVLLFYPCVWRLVKGQPNQVPDATTTAACCAVQHLAVIAIIRVELESGTLLKLLDCCYNSSTLCCAALCCDGLVFRFFLYWGVKP